MYNKGTGVRVLNCTMPQNTWVNGGISPSVFNFDARWRSVVVHIQLLLLAGKGFLVLISWLGLRATL